MSGPLTGWVGVAVTVSVASLHFVPSRPSCPPHSPRPRRFEFFSFSSEKADPWLPSLALKASSLVAIVGSEILIVSEFSWSWSSQVKIRKGVLLWKCVLDAIPQWKNYFHKSYFEAVCFEENCSGISVVLHLGHMFWP